MKVVRFSETDRDHKVLIQSLLFQCFLYPCNFQVKVYQKNVRCRENEKHHQLVQCLLVNYMRNVTSPCSEKARKRRQIVTPTCVLLVLR